MTTSRSDWDWGKTFITWCILCKKPKVEVTETEGRLLSLDVFYVRNQK
jgi:hypothetical protein